MISTFVHGTKRVELSRVNKLDGVGGYTRTIKVLLAEADTSADFIEFVIFADTVEALAVHSADL